MSVPLTADWLGVTLDIISAADLFIPQEALSEAAAELGVAAQAIRDLPDPPREVQQAVALTRAELKRAEPARAAAAPAVLDAAECLTNPSSSEFDPLNGVGADVDHISPAAIKCAGEMYSIFAGEEIPMGPILAELEIALKAMPEFADFIRFGNDWATVQALQPAALGYPSCENYVVRGGLGEIDVRSGGESFTVTVHGQPVADLVPHQRSSHQRRRLVPAAEFDAALAQLSPVDVEQWQRDREEADDLFGDDLPTDPRDETGRQ